MKSSEKTSEKEIIAELKKQLLKKQEELKHFKEINAQFELILSHTIPLCLTDKNFNILYVNESYSQLYNQKSEACIGSKCYENRPSAKCHTSECPMARLKKGKVKKTRCECRTDSGESGPNPMMVIARPYYDKKKRFAGIVETFHDITSRREAESALKENDKFLNAIFNTIQDGISVLDKDLNVLKVNNTMLDWYPNRKIIGEKCYKAYHNRKRKCKVCPSIRALEAGKLEVEEIPHPLSNGETGILEVFSFPMKDSKGEIVGAVEYARNITERRRAEESRINLVTELHNALTEVKALRGILPICSYCNNVRDDKGYWEKVDVYIHEHSEADVSHGICPECLEKYYPDHYKDMGSPKQK